MEKILSFAEARAVVEREAAQACAAVQGDAAKSAIAGLELPAAAGRILAEEISCERDLPPFPRATRDGFAVRSVDVAAAGEPSGVELKIVGEIAAGAAHLPYVGPGEAAAIMTGAPAPPGADAVVMVERTELAGNGRVKVWQAAQAGENIVPGGAEAKAGEVLLRVGERLTPAAVGLAAMAGRARVRVFPRARIAVLATGDELVELSAAPQPHQIRESNRYSLAAQIGALGAEPLWMPIAPDEPRLLRELIAEGLQADLLLLSGGVSMGKYDLVEAALGDFGAEFFFTGVRMQPGKPVVFGRARTRAGEMKYFFGLPGNPVSTVVTFRVFAQAIVEALGGAMPLPLLMPLARLKAEVNVKPGLARFLPARLGATAAGAEVEMLRWQGSGDMATTARANSFLALPEERGHFESGEMLPVLI